MSEIEVNGMNETAEDTGLDPESPDTVEDEPEKDWREEARANYDLYLRSQADMENMKKRLERERDAVVNYANEKLVKELLAVVDNLERALEQADKNGLEKSPVIEGVRLTYDQLMTILDRHGVSVLDAVGEVFDPNCHQAVMQREDDEMEPNCVLEEVQKGYRLKDRIVRPSMVVVSRKPA